LSVVPAAGRRLVPGIKPGDVGCDALQCFVQNCCQAGLVQPVRLSSFLLSPHEPFLQTFKTYPDKFGSKKNHQPCQNLCVTHGYRICPTTHEPSSRMYT